MGFTVTSDGHLCDKRGVILERGIMTRQLHTGLKAQRVNFSDDYHKWSKEVMIHKISTVMGIEWPHDPDPTYVLTVDNLIKILAIQIRFRYRHCTFFTHVFIMYVLLVCVGKTGNFNVINSTYEGRMTQ